MHSAVDRSAAAASASPPLLGADWENMAFFMVSTHLKI
jgi:hypothetical protein